MKFYVVLPTFRREEALYEALAALGNQSVLPTMTIVVDNASSSRCADTVGRITDEAPLLRVEYVDAGENTGSAGGTAIGMQLALNYAENDDWIMRCDDDLQPPTKDYLKILLEEGARCLMFDPDTGAIGRHGARYNDRKAKLLKPPHNPRERFVPVDYLATGWYPIFSVRAVREVGIFRSDLFFGLDEVEYGLRMVHNGYRLYRLDLPGHERLPIRRTSSRLEPPTWRRYYSFRNHIVISKEYFGLRASLRVAVLAGILKPLANLFTSPRLVFQYLGINFRAIVHAYQGRLGRTIEPTLVDATLQGRRDP